VAVSDSRHETPLLIRIRFIPVETLVPVRVGRVSQLRHRWAGRVEPGHYGDSVSDGKGLLHADTDPVVAVAPARPA
jgi:hypothetical protein